jgi:hypothetical protein
MNASTDDHSRKQCLQISEIRIALECALLAASEEDSHASKMARGPGGGIVLGGDPPAAGPSRKPIVLRPPGPRLSAMAMTANG